MRIPVISVIVLVGCVAAAAAQIPQLQPAQAEVAKSYSSPNAVFDAFREAVMRQDTRAEFRCCTPDKVSETIFEAFFACNTKKDPQIRALEQRFDMSAASVGYEYEFQYRMIHGKTARGNDSDDALMRKVLRDRLPDPAVYVAAVRDACRTPDHKPARVSPLKSVSIKGETAVGTFTVTWGTTPEDQDDRPINFRKTKDGWLIDMDGWN